MSLLSRNVQVLVSSELQELARSGCALPSLSTTVRPSNAAQLNNVVGGPIPAGIIKADAKLLCPIVSVPTEAFGTALDAGLVEAAGASEAAALLGGAAVAPPQADISAVSRIASATNPPLVFMFLQVPGILF